MAGNKATRKPQGMADYVGVKNEVDEFKVVVPKVERAISPNTRVPRSGTKYKQQSKSVERAPLSRQQPTAFYETDASSIDNSTLTSVQRKPLRDQSLDRGRDMQSAASDHDEEGSDDDADGNSESSSDEEMQASNVQPTAEQGEHRGRDPHYCEDPYAQRPPQKVASLPNIRGDSYPGTTSGRQSESDVAGPIQVSNTVPEQANPVKADHGGMLKRGSGTRVALGNMQHTNQDHGRPEAQTNESGRRAGKQSTKDNHFSKLPGHERLLMDQFNDGFSFAPRPAPWDIGHPNPAAALQDHSTQAASAGFAQHRSSLVHAQSQDHGVQVLHNHAHESRRARLANEKKRKQKQETESRKASADSNEGLFTKQLIEQPQRAQNPVTMPMHHRAPTADKPLKEGEPAEVPAAAFNGLQAAQAENGLLLDYDLHDITVEKLKEEDFDFDPRAEPFELGGDREDHQLPTKLTGVMNMDAEIRGRFFASLNIDQWEEAGEWFLERFTKLTKDFKEVRKEKRQATLDFEDQVERRRRAVSKKRKATEAALDNIKTHAQGLLQTTPKRTKKME